MATLIQVFTAVRNTYRMPSHLSYLIQTKSVMGINHNKLVEVPQVHLMLLANTDANT